MNLLQVITTTTGYRNTTLWLIDLSNFTSVVEFTDKFEADDVRLDIVVANAGVLISHYEASKDGWEQGYALAAYTSPIS